MTRLLAKEWSDEIEPFSPLPLHHQMTEILVSQLSRAMVSVGDVLPREEELADHFHISRNTVRRAYAELEADGWIERKAGRGTTLVRKPRCALPEYLINPERGLDQILELDDGAVVRRSLKIDASVPAEVAAFLDTRELTTIAEDGLVGGRRVGTSTWWIRTAVLEPSDVADVTVAHGDDQQGRLRQHLSAASITTLVVSRRANRQQAKDFDVAARAPLLEVHHQLESPENTPIAYAIALWRADEIGLRLVSHAG